MPNFIAYPDVDNPENSGGWIALPITSGNKDEILDCEEEEMPKDKTELRGKLLRARRGYNFYKVDQEQLDFPEYATLFYNIPLSIARKFWKTGDI